MAFDAGNPSPDDEIPARSLGTITALPLRAAAPGGCCAKPVSECPSVTVQELREHLPNGLTVMVDLRVAVLMNARCFSGAANRLVS
jgi:hypothetical protein